MNKDYTEKQLEEKKKTLKGKYELWRAGVEKFKQDPPIYRIHMMQGMMAKLTIYMIIFASIFAVSIGFWVFALIILPVGTIGNYYSMKGHFIKYKNSAKQYEMAGILVPIEKDVSELRKKWRIIEKRIGFIGMDFIFLIFLGALALAYFGAFSLGEKIGLVLMSLIPMYFIYFNIIYALCNEEYEKEKQKLIKQQETTNIK